jgi:hypothetical protein
MKTTAFFSVLCCVLRYLPLILNLIGRMREAFDPEKIPEVIKAFQELIAKITPPFPPPLQLSEIMLYCTHN